jgi:two-component system, NarL family, response regulator LiaR
MAANGSIDVLVVDDHDQFVSVLEAVLGSETDVEVVGTADNGKRAVELANELEPDVVLMDISMPVMDGFEATRRILAEVPETRVVMVTGSSADEDRMQARQSGAVGYIQKERILEDLSSAVRAAAKLS